MIDKYSTVSEKSILALKLFNAAIHAAEHTLPFLAQLANDPVVVPPRFGGIKPAVPLPVTLPFGINW